MRVRGKATKRISMLDLIRPEVTVTLLEDDDFAWESPEPYKTTEFIEDTDGVIRRKEEGDQSKWGPYRIRARDELHAYQMLKAWKEANG